MPNNIGSIAENRSSGSIGRGNLSIVKGTVPREDRPAITAYHLLHVLFTVLPIIAGLDKFFGVLADWTIYLSPFVPRVTGLGSSTIMGVVGLVEIIAGIGVAFAPRVFGYIVSLWLLCVVVNLLVLGNFFDIALRDLGLSVAAFALGEIAMTVELRRRARA